MVPTCMLEGSRIVSEALLPGGEEVLLGRTTGRGKDVDPFGLTTLAL